MSASQSRSTQRMGRAAAAGRFQSAKAAFWLVMMASNTRAVEKPRSSSEYRYLRGGGGG
jgi:hypothetical protein